MRDRERATAVPVDNGRQALERLDHGGVRGALAAQDWAALKAK